MNDYSISAWEKELEPVDRDHIAKCRRCAELERAQLLLGHDLKAMATEARQDLRGFHELRQRSLASYNPQKKLAWPDRWISLSRPRRIAISTAVSIIAILAVAFWPFHHSGNSDYDFMVAGVNENFLLSGTIDQLFKAIGLPNASIKNVECHPQCVFRVTGLRNIADARLAVAALQSVPEAIIVSADTFKDQRTSWEVLQTTSSNKITISNNSWILELGIDSTIYGRVSLALDSLKQDTTLTWTQLLRFKDGDVPGGQSDYTVNPDGSYSRSAYAMPQSQLGWSKDTWTYSADGKIIGRTITGRDGVSHDLDIRNWAVQEEQLKEFGMYYMITYDKEGRPSHTTTNFDPTRMEGYEPKLPPGMFLNQNDPNPFDTLTAITFGLPQNAPVSLKVYTSGGRLVRTLVDSTMAAGNHTITWDVRSDRGKQVRQLRYLCKLQVGENYRTIVMSQIW